MPLPLEIGDDEAFEELYELLRAIAAGRASDRLEAVRYSTCRGVLLASRRPRRLPGFVHQCLSVARYRDFIMLYHPDVAVREGFVRESFDAVRERTSTVVPFDKPRARKSLPDDWGF